MANGSARPQLTCCASLRWVKDSNQVLIVDDRLNTSITLYGVESTVWDWLMLGYNLSDLIDLLSVLCHESHAQAETWLVGLLQGWVKSGLINWQGQEHG